MWTSPTVTVTGALFTVTNPALKQRSSPTTDVQIANASGWLLNVQTLYGVVTVQPFEASTLPAPAGDLSVQPGAQIYNVGTNVTVAWMLKGERSPQPDGPLTAAALLASVTVSSPSRNVGNVQPNTYPYSFTVSGLQPSDQAVMIVGSPGTGTDYVQINSVTGHQSGITYATGDALSTKWPCIIPIIGALDSQLDIVVTGRGVTGYPRLLINACPFIPPPMAPPVSTFQYQNTITNSGPANVPIFNGNGTALFRILEIDWCVIATASSGLLTIAAPAPLFNNLTVYEMWSAGVSNVGRIDLRPGFWLASASLGSSPVLQWTSTTGTYLLSINVLAYEIA